MQIESYNPPMGAGGALVMPGDVIVAAAARRIQEGDKKGRLNLYRNLNRPPDFTVG